MKPDVRTSAAFIFTMYSNYINLFEKMICVAFRLCSVALESESVHPSMLCFSEKINILSVILTYFPHYSMAATFYFSYFIIVFAIIVTFTVCLKHLITSANILMLSGASSQSTGEDDEGLLFFSAAFRIHYVFSNIHSR